MKRCTKCDEKNELGTPNIAGVAWACYPCMLDAAQVVAFFLWLRDLTTRRKHLTLRP